MAIPIPFNALQATGDAALKRKELEHKLDSVLVAFVRPGDEAFFTDVVLHGSVISLSQKLTMVRSVARIQKKTFDHARIERFIGLLDVFVTRSHFIPENGSYVDAFAGEFDTLSQLYNSISGEYQAALSELSKL